MVNMKFSIYRFYIEVEIKEKIKQIFRNSRNETKGFYERGHNV